MTAFRDFIRNFVSVEESERVLAREMKAKRRKQKRVCDAAGGGGRDSDDDDGGDDNHQRAPSWTIPSDDDKIPSPKYQSTSKNSNKSSSEATPHPPMTRSPPLLPPLALAALASLRWTWMPCTSNFIRRRVNVCLDGWSTIPPRLYH